MAKICHKKITREKGGEEEVHFGLLILKKNLDYKLQNFFALAI
jgi:hypothetical protein